jgi:flavin-binding protein dodecin
VLDGRRADLCRLIVIKTAPPTERYEIASEPPFGGPAMSMLKVIEVLAESEKSWEDATQQAVKNAGKTVRGIKSIYLENLEATVENGKISKYRINAKISFLLDA